ncbi:uncharacterized protein LOC120167655 isoform X2 [Hibiscus syriacus]|nr:uncharacterized protein LOC120167655 isoform X2 [Hibiscus syriacus]
MRKKTPAFKRRPRNSIPPSNVQYIYPLHYQDDDNEEYHLHGNENGESADIGSSQDNANNSDDVKDDDTEKEGGGDGSGRGIAGYYDNDLVPDDVNEKDEDDNAVVPDCVEDG